ncbi:holliday junction resolvase [Hafnia phage yong3]|nr:holliday junction resolvase [Hafnia phage yong3]
MAGVSSQQKGKRGEREICDFFNDIYAEVHKELGIPFPEKPIAQRNQNQSAVGGCDISNTCQYAVEVKRQEALNINTWWKQCVQSGWELGKFPVLMFKQSRQKWRVMLFMNPVVATNSEWQWYEKKESIRAEISLEDFRIIFKAHAKAWLKERGSIQQ